MDSVDRQSCQQQQQKENLDGCTYPCDDDNQDSDVESRLYAEIYYSKSSAVDNEDPRESEALKSAPDAPIGNPIKTAVNGDERTNSVTVEQQPPSPLNKSYDKKSYQKNKPDSWIRDKNGKDTIVNPYNKQMSSKPSYQGMRLLSQEFFNLLFGKKSKSRRKKNAKTPQQNQTRKNLDRNEAHQASDVKINGENLKEKRDVENVIIDISSESSRDSTDFTSKYDAVETVEKSKLKIKPSVRDNGRNADNDSKSESDESIFEVPIPPKPAPLLIDLKDSDNESNDKDLAAQNEKNEEEKEPSSCFILNCTEIQKQAADLDEIREMCRETSLKNNDQEVHPGDAVVRPRKRKVAQTEDFFQPMSKKMKTFYNDSWGGENFDMEKLKSKMSSDPRKWAILTDDLGGTFPRRNKRFFGMVCNRCHKDGHRQNQCTEPYKSPTCHMCGVVGHFETSCPHKKCLTCGRAQRMYSKTCENCVKMLCSRCNSRGHLHDSCPDLWRRYHHTTTTNDVKAPTNARSVMKPQRELYCCNCAKKGHDSDLCKKLRWSQHFSNPAYVVAYDGPAYCDLLDNSNHITSFDIAGDSSSADLSGARVNVDGTPTRHRKDAAMSMGGRKSVATVFDIKSSSYDQTQTMRSLNVDLALSADAGSDADDPENWRHLIKFLKTLASNVQGHFLLQRKNNKHLRVSLNCSRNYIIILAELIKQYASRNNFERSRMLLSWERDAYKVADQFYRKMTAMRSLTADPLEIHEECERSSSSEQQQDRLAILQENLLAVLYREGFADDSLTKLKKLTDKIRKYNASSVNAKSRKKKHLTRLMKFKSLLEYLYLYNNVFTPHRPKNLSKFIESYKNHLRMRDNVIMNNDRFLFSLQEKDTRNAVNDVDNDDRTVEPRATTTLTDGNGNCDISQSDAFPTSTKNLESLNLNENEKVKSKGKNFECSYNQVKSLIAIAKKLDAPHLRSHVDVLEDELNLRYNGANFKRKDVLLLRKLVGKELKERERERQRDGWMEPSKV